MSDGVMVSERLLKGRTGAVGEFETRGGVVGRIMEPAREVALKAPVAASPADVAVDDTYRAGPAFVLHIPDGYVDPANGFAFTSRRSFVRETAMVQKYADRAEALYPSYDFDAAYPIRSGELAVMSNQRGGNYCRWWLDTVSKLYLFETFPLTPLAGRRLAATVAAPIEEKFQAASLELMGYPPGLAIPPGRLIRGDLLLTTGLTYGGGQNISPLVRDFGAFVLEKAGLSHLHQKRGGRRIFITRQHTRMRRILNETELHKGLMDQGFEIVALEKLSMAAQIEAFAQADVIVAPHGAGLTNLMFCQPGTLLVEIFPDCGLHSSAFRRMATNLDVDYALFLGPAASVSEKNPRDVDLTVDSPHLLAFINDLVANLQPKAVATA